MHVINAMLGKGLGGIEQCLIDYSKALLAESHRVTCIIHPDAAIKSTLLELKEIDIIEIRHHGDWDIFAKIKLKKALAKIDADIAIAHGNRALKMLKSACHTPIVGVTHNYKLKHIKLADAVLALTQDLANAALQHGAQQENIYPISNMIHPPQQVKAHDDIKNTPPVIATMGRFVKKKGFDVFIEALTLLKDEGVAFKAFIAGDGEERASLEAQAANAGLDDCHLTFLGWINDKSQLFDKSDIFCIPSQHEPFGIIVLEALAHGIATISTKSEGPREILTHKKNALLIDIGDARAMADAIKTFLNDAALRQQSIENGLALIENSYTLPIIAKKLSQALEAIKMRSRSN